MQDFQDLRKQQFRRDCSSVLRKMDQSLLCQYLIDLIRLVLCPMMLPELGICVRTGAILLQIAQRPLLFIGRYDRTGSKINRQSDYILCRNFGLLHDL